MTYEELEQDRDQWIGGTLMDIGDPQHPRNLHDSEDGHMGHDRTTITDIELKRNKRKQPTYFEVRGQEFTCGFDLKVGRMVGKIEDSAGREWIQFSGHDNHSFRIMKP